MLLSTATLCLALNIYHEARGEPLDGQIAVANVTMNRAESDRRKVCSVVTEKSQFSWTIGAVHFTRDKAYLMKHARPTDMKAWKQSLRVAKYVLNGARDESRGATFYHADRVKPKWRLGLQKTRVIGNHIFYKERYGSNERHNGRQPAKQEQFRLLPGWLGAHFWEQERAGHRWNIQFRH